MRRCLLTMTPKQALIMAKDMSGLTEVEIATRSGISFAQVKRYFTEYDEYYPSIFRLPALCRALGNSIPLDWLRAQMEVILPPLHKPKDMAEAVARSAMRLSMQSGRVCEVTGFVIEDHVVEPHEAETLAGELFALKSHADDALSTLSPMLALH